MCKLTKREEYIKSIFLPQQRSSKKTYLSELEVYEIIGAISDIGSAIGFVGANYTKDKIKREKREHKYDVWIAKEIKKNLSLLKKTTEFFLIIDWAIGTNCDLFQFSFESAMLEQETWHQNLIAAFQITAIDIPEIEQERIIYRCSDKEYFLYLLDKNDLVYEGQKMSMCIGQKMYKDRIRNGTYIYLSLRDKKNEPHITIEIETGANKIRTIVGKANTSPDPKYLDKILEFILFYTRYDKIERLEQIKLLNLKNLL